MRYAIMINGVTELSMMKSDILSIFNKIKVCTHYLVNGEKVSDFPFDVNDIEIIPFYEEIDGWNSDLTKLRDYKDAPQALKNYVSYLEKQLRVPINVISVGPDRTQTLSKLS
jgi:adenylosuccinate synthase